jgi:hypothetical protein
MINFSDICLHYGGHGLDGRSRGYVAAPCNNREAVNKWCAATKKGRCRLHGGAKGSGGPSGERTGQYRHGERTKAAIAEQRKFTALLKIALA